MTTNFENWKIERDQDQIVWAYMDRKNEAVNSINADVMNELNQLIDDIGADSQVKGLIIGSAKKTGFIAGADIEQFTQIKDYDTSMAFVLKVDGVLEKIENLKIPTVAMINGFCFGGGTELSLACRYRVALDDPETKIGLPEVLLGIRPGWGGSVRLPRLIGAVKAMGLILTGRAVSAKAAAKMGFVDAAVPLRELTRAAKYYVDNKPKPHQPSFIENLTNHRWVRPILAKKMYASLQQKVQKAHYPAPYAIVKTWVHDGVSDKAIQGEADSISKLILTETSRNLVRVFFLQTKMKSFGKKSDFKPQNVHVIGAGTMGGDIAAWCALRGMSVTLQDREPKFIAPALKRAYQLFKKKLKKPLLIQHAMDRLMPDVKGLGVEKADVVIEAIYENLVAKQALYKDLEGRMKPGAILATNTSSLPLDELCTVLKNKENLVGIHFFNPVAKMQLVEVVRGQQTAQAVVDKATAFVRKISRLPLPVKSEPGFLVNRVLMPYIMESVDLIKEGVSIQDIDKAAVMFGMPMGPVELADTVGLDICLSVAEILSKHYGGEVPVQLREMVEKKQLGRKTGKGFYSYNNKGKPIKAQANLTDKQAQLLADRMILRMLNTAMACWREKIVEDADLLDAGMIFGTGFAPFRGGPMHYAQSRGPEVIKATLADFAARYGERYQPDAGWDEFMRK